MQKISSDDSYGTLQYGVSGMQGWRMSMEDAHCCLPNIDGKSTALFGVFDGHGGKEVAEYCALNLHNFLMDTEAFTEGDMQRALRETYMNIDEAITSDEVIKELKTIGGFDNEGSQDGEEDDEAAMLLEEANMPLGDLLERLKNSAQEQLDIESGESANEDSKDTLNGNSNGTNGHNSKPAVVENGACNGSPSRSRKQKKPVKRNVDEIQTDVSVIPSTAAAAAERGTTAAGDEQTLNVRGGASGSSAGGSSSDDASAGSVEGSSSKSLQAKLDEALDDEHDPEYTIDDDENEDEDEEDEEELEEGEEESESDSEEEFEDSEGVDFQHGTDEVGKDSGTTAIAALIQGNKLYVANVGDSRCVLCRNGQALELSLDHKPEDTIEFARIEKAGAKVTGDGRVNGGLNLSRALGDHVYKQNKSLSPEEQAITADPDIKEIELNSSDEFMVLACDGIWNVMTSAEVIQFVKERLDGLINEEEKVPLSKICEELFDLCLAPDTKNDGSGCDNMTAMIVRLNCTPAAPTTTAASSSTTTTTGEKRTPNDSFDDENCQKSKKLKVD